MTFHRGFEAPAKVSSGKKETCFPMDTFSYFPAKNVDLTKHLTHYSTFVVSSLLVNENCKKVDFTFFGSTSLLRTCTRWDRSNIKLCTAHCLSSALSINLSNINFFWQSRKSNPGQLGEKRKRYLFAMRPPVDFKCLNVFKCLNLQLLEGQAGSCLKSS